MKPQFLKVNKGITQSFNIRRDLVPYFYNQWHYHPELELIHLKKGSGTQFIGDNIQRFQEDTLLLVGSNLPHYWRCDEKYFEGNESLYAEATVIHFLAELWGGTFLALPENQGIRELFKRSNQGLRFWGSAKENVICLMQQVLLQTPGNRLLGLYQILDTLSESTEYELICSTYTPIHFDEDDTDRINRIYTYSLANFQEKITIEDVAAVANISPNSFCRYFKSRTNKTYFRFLLELRVGHACKLLIGNNHSVAQVCFESGFNTFSNFNKYFKEITGKSPVQYQKEYWG